MEEEIADQTDDKTENTDLKTVEHPRMSVYSIRRFSIVKDGEEVFQIKQEPADYKWISTTGKLPIRMMRLQQ